MANILPKDEELFKKIETEHIQVDPVFWNVIYQYIGDAIIAINLIVRSFIDYNDTVPKEELKKILDHTRRLIEVIKKIRNPETIPNDEKDGLFRTIRQKNLKLDPVTYELFGNYVRNDINIINLICMTYTDSSDRRAIVRTEDARKILEHTRSTMAFLDRLRKATVKMEAF